MSVQDAPTAVKIGIGRKSDTILVTDAAAAKVASLLEAEGDTSLALRVAVRPGGCSGFSYEMFFDGETATLQTVFVIEGGALEHSGTGGVGDHADRAVGLHHVVVGHIAIEKHFVGETRATAGTDGDAQGQ